MGIGGSVWSILIQFLSNWSQHVTVDGCQSILAIVVSGVAQGSVLNYYCSSCPLRSFFPFWKIGWSVMPMTPLWLMCHPLALELMTFEMMTFEKHHRSVSRAASRRVGISRKSWRVFHDWLILRRCFQDIVLPVLEYCSAVWCSLKWVSADTHFKLLDCVVSGAIFLTMGLYWLWHCSSSICGSTVYAVQDQV